MSSYSILAGPALAIEPSSSRYYALMNTEIASFVGSVEVNKASKVYLLSLNSSLQSADDLGALLSFLTALAKQHKGENITATGNAALVLAIALANNVASTNTQIVQGWTSLNFVLEAVADSTVTGAHTPVKVRFTGSTLQGIKQITNASSITLTINAK
jgi:hypothetical protein